MKHYYERLGQAAWIVAAVFVLSPIKSLASPDQTELVFVGSGHKNICAFWLNLTSGALDPIGEVAQVAAPSFLTISPNRRCLYAVSEGRDKDSSFVNAFRIDLETGKLALLNRQLSGGAGPCHVNVDPKGEDVLVANYGSGSVSVFPIAGQGELGPMSAFVQDRGSSVNSQ